MTGNRTRRFWCGLAVLALLGACKQEPEQAQLPASVPNAVSVQEIEGEWNVLRIDGNDVRAEGYWLKFEEGRIMGGYDGCNHWGRQYNGGQWLVISTLVGCHEKTSRQAYDAVAAQMQPDSVRRNEQGALLLTSAGHEIEMQAKPAGAPSQQPR